MWKHLDHPNVVAFKGITLNPLQLVSEWIPGGELREYIKKNPDANHANLVGSFLPTSVQYLTFASVARHRQRSRIPPLLRRYSRRSQRGACYYLSWCILFDGTGDSQTSWWMDPEMHESWTSVSQASSGLQAQ